MPADHIIKHNVIMFISLSRQVGHMQFQEWTISGTDNIPGMENILLEYLVFQR